jgi:flagellar protein FlaJ
MNSYVKFCYNLLGENVSKIKKPFLDMENDLKRAKINYTLEEYLSTAVVTVALTFSIEVIVLSFAFGLFLDLLTAVLLASMLSIMLTGFLGFVFYAYPATMAKSRESDINRVLPFAISYMSSVASGRVEPVEVFRTVSQFEEYGKVSEECKNVVRNVEVFGMNISDAIKHEAARTPSQKFKEILWGINAIVASGGDLFTYLKERSNMLMNEHKRAIRKFAQDLTIFVEIYLTLIIVGSIFFIVISSIMSTVGGGLEIVLMQSFIVFILLPTISIGFIILIKGMSPY